MVLGWRRGFSSSIPKDREAQCNSPKQKASSASPRTPSSFSLLKSTLRLSTKQRSGCGICHQTVQSGQGSAIFTAECSHSFHFPCIAAHVKPHHFLVCPLCNTVWKDLPLLPHHNKHTLKIKSLRVYNDDEPLLSPTSCARFNSIPESNEEEEEGDFQGFFAKPTSSTSPKSPSQIAVNLLPEAAVLAVGRGCETYAVTMRVKAPPAGGGSRRDPIDLVTVVDVSETMNGIKLQTLKRAMRLLISSLSESDRLSIVAFSASSNRLLPLRRMTMNGRRTARRVVDALGSAGQGMCVSDALKKAAKVLEDRRHQNPAASIILFTGGPTISSTRFSNIPVHAITITDGGEYGNALPDDALAMCLGTRVVHDLTLQLGSGQAHIAAVYSVASKQAVYGSGLVRVGDLLAGEERELLVELRVPVSSLGSQQFLSVRSSYKDPSSGVVVHTKQQALTVPRPHSVRSSSQSIIRLRNLHVTVRAIAESRRLIEHDDMSGAQRLLASARALLLKPSAGSPEELLRGLEVEQADLERRRVQKEASAGNEEALTPTSAWRAAERLAKVAIMRKSMNRVSDLYGFEDARF